MTKTERVNSSGRQTLTNGPGAAAIFAGGIGAFALAILAVGGDKSALMKSMLIFYRPTGVLSGVTTTAVVIWLVTWVFAAWRWRHKTVNAGRITAVALILLVLSLLLTFPPIADLL